MQYFHFLAHKRQWFYKNIISLTKPHSLCEPLQRASILRNSLFHRTVCRSSIPPCPCSQLYQDKINFPKPNFCSQPSSLHSVFTWKSLHANQIESEYITKLTAQTAEAHRWNGEQWKWNGKPEEKTDEVETWLSTSDFASLHGKHGRMAFWTSKSQLIHKELWNS